MPPEAAPAPTDPQAPAPSEPAPPPEQVPPEVGAELEAQGEIALEPEVSSEPVQAGEEIVVTGSRLRKTAFSTSAPVSVIKREDLERSGYTTFGDLVRHMSEGAGNGSGSGTTGQAGGSYYENQGVQMVNLRGLGANATLVLVNGRRLIANGPGGALESFSNLATIPMAMIERIEILRGGASAIYGSDAIAGVVNIITRKKTDGIKVEASALSTDRFDQQEYEGNLVAGGGNDRSRFTVGLSWYHSTPLDAVDRDWTKGQFWSAIGPIGIYVPISRAPMGGTAFAADQGFFELFPDPACPDPQGFLRDDPTQKIADIEARLAMLPPGADERIALERQLTAYRLSQRFQGPHPNDPSLPYLAGDREARGWWPASVPPGDPRAQQAISWDDPAGFACSWDFGRYRQLRPEMTRISSMLSASHDLTNHLTVEIEAQYSDNRTISKTQPSPLFRDARLNSGYFYDIGSTPWTADLTRDDGTLVPQGNSYSLWYGYPPDYNAPANESKFEGQTFRSVLAFKGDFESAAEGTIAETWDWEVAGTYARSTWDARYMSFHTGAAQRALDACRVTPMGTLNGLANTPANRARAGCFNPYYSSVTDPELANPPDLLRKMLTKFNNMTVTELYTADATLRGEIVPLPGGPLSFAVGGQYRYESRAAVFDNDTNLNQTPFGGIDDTAKSRDVWSTYAELGVPVLRGIELQPAIRYETYKQIGDAISPRVGLVIRVGDFFEQPPSALSRLALRGSYSRAFRAPNLAQTDPAACAFVTEDVYTPRANPDPIARSTARTQLLNGRACGSSDLGPEKATSYSAGVEWNFGNLRVESDYWHYDYSERIIQPLIQRAVDRNANRGYCLIDPNAPMAGQSMRARAFVATLAARQEYFQGVDCAALSREEGVPEKSLTPEDFINKYPEVMYVGATGNPENGTPLIRYRNASEVMTRGIDFGVSYSLGGRDLGLQADIGTFSLGLKGSYLFNFQYREAPASDTVSCAQFPDDATCEKEAAGKRNLMNFNDVMPRMKFSVPFTYGYRRHQLALIAHYIAGFKDDGETYDPFDPPPANVPSWTTFDFQYALDLSEVFGSPVMWRVGVQNIFDRDPPRIRQRDAGGFEPSVHDGRGRLLYTRIGLDL